MLDSHKDFEDRENAARYLETYIDDIALYVDRMDDKVNQAFGALPERLYIIQDNVVLYQGGMGPMGYHLSEIENWIEQFMK